MGYLFLGGPWDGRWAEVDGIRASVAVPIMKSALSVDQETKLVFERATYTLRSFHLDWGQEHAGLYALDTLTDMEAFTMLLEGYKPCNTSS